jgi:pyruvate formate lyase activating enzyme
MTATRSAARQPLNSLNRRENSLDPAAGAVSSWDLSTGVDGPGTRFVVFLTGCELRCLYCQNPETWYMRDGRRMSVTDVLDEAAKYTRFITVAGGGATISGGEPLLQPAFTHELLRGFQALGLHTALDTAGALGHRASDGLLADVDLVLLDIKSWDRDTYRRVTGGDVRPTLDFAIRLAELERPTIVRFVLVPGQTDELANVQGTAEFVASLPNVQRVDVLPFHRMAAPKYTDLGLTFPLAETPPPSPELLHRVREQFRLAGVAVS